MGGIFINYRGEDSELAAALIDRELVARFGRDRVFLDSRSIPPGVDFEVELLGWLRASSVVVVVIGPRWLSLTDEVGRRRIDDPRDWIRREIAEAFHRGLRVVPVLTDGVELPADDDLPADIADLSRRQYVLLRRRYTTVDLAFLAEQVIEHDPELATAAARYQPTCGPIPRQLPAAPQHFTGRADALAALTAALDEPTESGSTVVISAIGGLGGIGKTWLALRWAHQHAERFPDGQLFVDLHGYDPAGEPTPPATAARGFLDALGVDPAAIPGGPDAQLALYRSLVAGRRMLILLDNVRDTSQIVPLLPGAATCTVVVTSRNRLPSLITIHAARPVGLDLLPEAEARQLLAEHLCPDRLAAEPDAVAALLTYCGGLPLALCIVAARAGGHPDFPLRVLAEELHDQTTRLDGLDAGEFPLNLRAVFGSSYNALTADAATLFDLLGLAPGPDISHLAAASLMGLPMPRMQRLLRELELAHLVTQYTPGRYRMHDLLRLYAADQAYRRQPDAVRDTAVRRLVNFYLHTSFAAERCINPDRESIVLPSPRPGVLTREIPDRRQAWAWFTAEHPNLLAAIDHAGRTGSDVDAWQLPWTLATFLDRHGHWRDCVDTQLAALVAVRRLGDRCAQARIHRLLGWFYLRLHCYDSVHHHIQQALTIWQELGDINGQATAYHGLSLLAQWKGRHAEAVTLARQAFDLYQTGAETTGQATALNTLGWNHAKLGGNEHALTHCQHALRLFSKADDRFGKAESLGIIGYANRQLGRLDLALDYYQKCVTLRRELGDHYLEADALINLGDLYHTTDDPTAARDHWQRALAILDKLQHPDGQLLRTKLEAQNQTTIGRLMLLLLVW